MNNLENLPEDIFDLISTKPFENLSPVERSKVLESMDKETYVAYQNLVSEFRMNDKHIEENISVTPMVFPKEKHSRLLDLFRYQIPVYKVAAGLLLCFISGYYVASERSINHNGSQSDNVIIGKSILEDGYPEELVFNF